MSEGLAPEHYWALPIAERIIRETCNNQSLGYHAFNDWAVKIARVIAEEVRVVDSGEETS